MGSTIYKNARPRVIRSMIKQKLHFACHCREYDYLWTNKRVLGTRNSLAAPEVRELISSSSSVLLIRGEIRGEFHYKLQLTMLQINIECHVTESESLLSAPGFQERLRLYGSIYRCNCLCNECEMYHAGGWSASVPRVCRPNALVCKVLNFPSGV